MIFDALRDSMPGLVAAGVADVEEVEASAWQQFEDWLSAGKNAEMRFMENHLEIRRNPELLLPGAKSIISLAFSYSPQKPRPSNLPVISDYALSYDYHDELRRIIRHSPAISIFGEKEGEDFRICVDSAPVMERYWGVKAGVGYIGGNGNLIVPGAGSAVVLAEIVCKAHFKPSNTLTLSCPENCNRCRAACPTKALRDDSTIDCRKCLSYLTIEHRGEWSDTIQIEAMRTLAGRNTLFGCDRCLKSCPQFHTKSPGALTYHDCAATLTPSLIMEMTQEDLSKKLKGSPLKRAKAAGLYRNALNCTKK